MLLVFWKTIGCAVLLTATANSANALTINLIESGYIPPEAQQGYRAAADYWQSVLTNNATVNIIVKYDAVNAVSQSFVATTIYNVQSWENLVSGSQSNFALDQNLVLPSITNGSVDFITQAPSDYPHYYTDAEAGRFLLIDKAALKAAYNSNFQSSVTDGLIELGGLPFDFDPRDGIDAGKLDFVEFTLHEMGHVLGFTSGVDAYFSGETESMVVNAPNFMPLDMFRYSHDLWGLAPGTAPVLDLSFGQELNPSYFSIDGGQTALFGNSFSSGSPYQASHWTDPGPGTAMGVMVPSYCDGCVRDVTALDLAAMDAIGWNLNFDVLANPTYRMTTAGVMDQYMRSFGVPEPATWTLMIGGFGLAGANLRRRRALAA